MINKLRNVELEYVRCFSEEKEYESLIEFRDEMFRDSYTGNVSIIKRDIDDEELINIINKEVKAFKERREHFLNIEVNKYISKDIIKSLIRKPKRVDRFNYLLIDNIKYSDLEENGQLFLKEVKNSLEFKNLIDINVKDNEKILGRSYALYRIKRKIKSYKNTENNLESYICYYDNKPIGSCEILRIDNICKIEDVGILEKYRGRGFGSYMINKILEENHKRGIEYTYLISEENGEAEKLYKRLGFTKFSKKTQLIW